jgi:hypothetical protein
MTVHGEDLTAADSRVSPGLSASQLSLTGWS